MDYVKMACLKCGQGNRVPNEKLASKPKCAKCASALMTDKAMDLTPQVLDKAKKPRRHTVGGGFLGTLVWALPDHGAGI